MGCTTSRPDGLPNGENPKILSQSFERSKSDCSLDENNNLKTDDAEEAHWRFEPGKALDHYLKRNEINIPEPICIYLKRENSRFDYFENGEYLQLRNLLDEKYGRHYFLQFAKERGESCADLVTAWILMHKYHRFKDPNERYKVGNKFLGEFLEKYAPATTKDEVDVSTDAVDTGLSLAPRYGSPILNGLSTIPTIPEHKLFDHDSETTDLESPQKNTDVADTELTIQTASPRTSIGSGSFSESDVAWEVPPCVVNWIGNNLAKVKGEFAAYGSKDGAPVFDMFFELQAMIFKELITLHRFFVRDAKYTKTYLTLKKLVYNKVKPNDFKYMNVIGKGGFGKVVHVVKKSTGKHYAMKIQAKDRLLDTWGKTMAHVEIERDVLVASEKFPFIITLRYAFQSEHYAFLILDLAEAGSLSNVIQTTPGFQLEEAQVRLYCAEIVLALQSLHEHGIMYRDLKPANVLLGADGHITLADMGLAGFYYQQKYYETDPKTPRTTNDTVRASISKSITSSNPPDAATLKRQLSSHDTDCGTPLYRPPEMITSRKYGPEVDWFMLGVFTFECLFGRLPFEPAGGLTDSGVANIADKDNELQCLLRHKLRIPAFASPQSASFITSLLELDPEKRLGSGPAEDKLDLKGMMDHPFFWGLEGPCAESVDWGKVLRKEYEPVFLPTKFVGKNSVKYSSFEALLKEFKRNAKKREKHTPRVDIPTLQEGGQIADGLQHYFDNWDYVCPGAVAQELAASSTSRRSMRGNKNKDKS